MTEQAVCFLVMDKGVMSLKGAKETAHALVKGPVLLMGIVNVTPDSFSDGGRFVEHEAAIAHAQKLAKEGAELVDIGGESTRPGADLVSVDEELARILPIIKGLKEQGRCFDAKISIDTRKAEVMRAAIEAGVELINDVSALQYDEDSLDVAARFDGPVILMHGKGDPKTMQNNPVYQDVVQEVREYLAGRIKACEQVGIDRSRLIIDPGIGFGKTLKHNLALLAHLKKFTDLGVPLLLGASRKRFIGTLSREEEASRRAPGSIAAALAGVSQGVQIVRVHDVKKTRQALDVWQAIERAKG